MSQVSVIIVSWNARDYLKDCLASVKEAGGSLIREVIVVDNASSDGSSAMVAEHFPEIRLIQATTNLGFARANNLGIQHASSPFLALINSDVIIRPGCLQHLVAALDGERRVGLAGPKIFGADGQLQHTSGRLPTIWNTMCRLLALDRTLSRWSLFSGLQMRHWTYDSQAPVEVLSGCFWLARRAAVDEVGELDEKFFFYAEDVDWCKRFRDCGWELVFVPEAIAIHRGGGSSSNLPLRYSIELLRANLLYWNKHHGRLGRSIYYSLALARHVGRLLVRGILAIIGLANGQNKQGRKEDIACLRWLLTGKNL